MSAPLADPSATAAEQHVPAVDAALRHVAHALLVGVDEKQVMENTLQVSKGLAWGVRTSAGWGWGRGGQAQVYSSGVGGGGCKAGMDCGQGVVVVVVKPL